MLPKVLHLEPTDACNLACPLCARETNYDFDKSQVTHLTIEQLKLAINEETISQLEKMFMCGNYGDPAAGKNTLDLYHYFRSLNPSITLGMNTNGGLKSADWWIKLANILSQPKDYVVFSIDGLEDTNHIYRKNIHWDTLIRNATAFIDAGGSAHWDMLVYKHNEHQVDQCQELAKQLGFKWFRAKVSKRPLTDNLEYPIHWNKNSYTNGPIKCRALQENSIYIDARGKRSPCCWLGIDRNNLIVDVKQVEPTWATNAPNVVCQKTCSSIENLTNFERQWQREIEFM